MQSRRAPFLFFALVLVFPAFAGRTIHPARVQSESPGSAAKPTDLHRTRSSPLDLEVGGDVVGLLPGETGYITREQLLALPQVAYTVNDDPNFKGPAEVGGVLLEELAAHLSRSPRTDLIIALCNDKYRANYSRAYVAAQHPILVLKINGKDPAGWPKDPEGQGEEMGPYLISHAKFLPALKILSHQDEPQIPWGVIRIEFRDEQKTFAAIAPRGPHAQTAAVQAGYRIAKQNCFRCHNMGSEGGQKAGHPWLVLSAWASASPEFFAAYIHDPKSQEPNSKMPAFPIYDRATLKALTAYFQTFTSEGKQ